MESSALRPALPAALQQPGRPFKVYRVCGEGLGVWGSSERLSWVAELRLSVTGLWG